VAQSVCPPSKQYDPMGTPCCYTVQPDTKALQSPSNSLPQASAPDPAPALAGCAAVPFVLAIGVGFSEAVNAREGFGILTTSSVAPIISVLFINLIKKPAKKVSW